MNVIVDNDSISKHKGNSIKKTITFILSEYLFPLLHFIQQQPPPSALLMNIGLFITSLQLLIYPFQPRFAPIWNNDNLYSILSQSFHYLKLCPILKGNIPIYLIVFYCVIIIFLGYLILFIYSIFMIKQGKVKTVLMFRSILEIPSSLVGQIIFLPFLEILISINYCDNSTMLVTYISTMQCKSKGHTTHQIFGNMFFGLYSILTLLMEYFNIQYHNSMYNIKAKKTTLPEVGMLLLKVFLSAINAIFSDSNYRFVVIFISFIFSLSVCLSFYYYRPYYDNKMMLMHLLNSMLITYSFCILSIYYFLLKFHLNGGLYLCILGNVIIILFILIEAHISKVRRHSLFMSPYEWKREAKVIEHLKTLELVCDISDSFRYCNVLLEGYIGRMEEECTDAHCMLKQYLKTQNKKYLFKHIENLYQVAIRRFVNCINIRINYIEFEHNKMKNVKKSKKILDDLLSRSDELTWMNQFLLFQLSKNLMSENSNSLHGNNSKGITALNDGSNEVFINYAYSTLKTTLKCKITEVVSNYLLFWNVLLSTHKDINQDLSRLSLLGSKIALLNEDITKTYDKLIKLNCHNCPMKKLYNLYQKEILHIASPASTEHDEDEDAFDDNDSITSIISNYMEDNSAKLDSLLSKENKVVIVSGDKPAFGRIVKISTGASSMFGFTKNELLGQHINVLLPFIIQQPHNEMLVIRAEEQKQRKALVNTSTLAYRDSCNDGSNCKGSLINANHAKRFSKDKVIYALTKSKYLLKAHVKVSIVITESEKMHFVARFYHDFDVMGSSIATKGECYVLTNNAFYIENFSPNSEIILGLRKENVFSHPCDISNLIKEFSEDSLKLIADFEKDNKHILHKNSNNHNGTKVSLNERDARKYRKEMIIANYLNYINPITWKSNSFGGSSIISNYENSGTNSRILYLHLSEIKINKKTYGYIFSFGVNDKNILTRKVSKKHFIASKKVNDLFDLDRNQQNMKQSFVSKCPIFADFVPEPEKGFFIDINKMAYKTISQDEVMKYKQQIQNNAIDKIKQIDNVSQSDNSSLSENTSNESYSYSSNDESEGSVNNSNYSYTSSEYSKGIRESKVRKNNSNKRKILFKGEQKDIVNNDYINNYYKVDFTNIKYMLYDFDRMIVMEVNTSIQSQMQEKLQENTNNNNINNNDNTTNANTTNANTSSQKSILTKRITDKSLDSQRRKGVELQYNTISGAINEAYIPKGNKPHSQQHPSTSKPPESPHSSLIPLKQSKQPSTNIFPSYSYTETNPLITRAYFFTDEVILKQISFMLKTKDKHSSVLWLKIISFLIIIATTIEVIVFISSLENAEIKGSHYLAVISASSFYFFSSMTAMYHVRELLLTNNSNYTHTYDLNRTNYRINNTLEIVKVYNMLITSRNSINAHQNILTEQTFHIINNQTVSVYYINQYRERLETKVSTTTALALLQNALFAITQLPSSSVIPLHPDIAYFMLNAPNSNFAIASKQNDLFLYEYEMHLHRIVSICLMGILIIWIVHFMLLFVLYHIHSKVIVIREKYLEVFYDLEQETIISCMQKCECFLTQLNDTDSKDGSNNNESNNNDINENEVFLLNEDNANVNTVSGIGGNNVGSNVMQQHKQGTSSHRHHRKSNHAYNTSLVLWICFVVIVQVDVSGVLIYQILSKDKKLKIASLIDSSQQIKMAVVLVFTLLREYIYDPNIMFNHTSIFNNTLHKIKEQYDSYYYEEEYIRSNIESIYPDLLDSFHILMHRNICSYADAFFKSFHNVTGNCGSFTNNVSYYGFHSLVNFFFMEVDGLYFKHELLMKMLADKNFRYNLTLVGTGTDLTFWPSDPVLAKEYEKLHPIQLFNDNLHLTICVIYRFLLSPCFTKLSSYIHELATNVRETMVRIDYVGLLIALIVLVIAYRAIWTRYEEKIEEVIYKTKKMLSIIPIEELIKVKSIKKLLNIDEQSLQRGKVNK